MIELTGVGKAFGEVVVFDQFDLRLPEQGVVCLMGPSGRGKTTLLRLLAGLEQPDSGQISGLPRPVAMQFQEDRLLPWLTVGQNIALATGLKPSWGQSLGRFSGLLTAFGLEEWAGARPGQLSGGMSRRVALARALAFRQAASAPLVLLDEPFSGVDDATRDRLVAHVRPLLEGALTVMVSHDQSAAAAFGGHVLEL